MRLYDYLMTHWPQQQEKFWNVDGDDMSVVKDGMGDGHPSSGESVEEEEYVHQTHNNGH